MPSKLPLLSLDTTTIEVNNKIAGQRLVYFIKCFAIVCYVDLNNYFWLQNSSTCDQIKGNVEIKIERLSDLEIEGKVLCPFPDEEDDSPCRCESSEYTLDSDLSTSSVQPPICGSSPQREDIGKLNCNRTNMKSPTEEENGKVSLDEDEEQKKSRAWRKIILLVCDR